MPHIHPTAIIHPNAVLAETVRIGPYVIIEENVTIDEGTILESSNRIAYGARIGKNCVISHGTVASTIPQDKKFDGEDSILIIGDNTKVREYCTLNRGTKASGKTIIGKNVLLMAYCHVAHDCIVGDETIIANGVQLAGHVLIEDYAIIGGMAVIQQFSRIGKYCMVGGSAGVNKDIPPFTLAGHYPVSFQGLNSIGLRRRGFSRETIESLDKMYSIIFFSGYNVSDAIAKIREELFHIAEVREAITFIEQSTIGILRPRSKSQEGD